MMICASYIYRVTARYPEFTAGCLGKLDQPGVHRAEGYLRGRSIRIWLRRARGRRVWFSSVDQFHKVTQPCRKDTYLLATTWLIYRLTTQRRVATPKAVSGSGWNGSEGMAWEASFLPAGD